MSFKIEPIGILHSPFKQKFAIPRQPGLTSAKAQIELLTPFNNEAAFEGIEQFSHLWLSFIFHQNVTQGWTPQVRPPRMGGNKKMGVFATRSSFRPNHLGLSVVKFVNITRQSEKLFLTIQGADLVDQTPIIDIKPYVPYADCISTAVGGFAQHAPKNKLKIEYSEQSQVKLKQLQSSYSDLASLIEEVLQQDPRPAYKKKSTDNKVYAVQLYNFDIHWQVNEATCHIIDILSLD